jgi:3-hydroxyisobutyrate dehydrogenase/glyoxylate/succinic semialdehyde reductase
MGEQNIAFIGLGIMGSRMAKNLLKAGFPLTVHNRTKEKAEDLIRSGAQWADSPKKAAENADIVFTMLSHPEVVEAVVYADNGLFSGIKPGALWVDMSTVHPTFSKKMAEASSAQNIRFLDAPVSGSKIPAERGELIFLVGGEQTDFEEAKPYFEAMGKAVHYLGKHGNGSAMKILINLMLAHNMAAFSETVHLGEAMGLDKSMVVEMLLNHPVSAPILQGKKAKIMELDFTPEFPLEHMQKDLHLVALTAFEKNYAMPLANVLKELYAQAKQHGYGRMDMSAIYKWLGQE